jgi:hypothetical protein
MYIVVVKTSTNTDRVHYFDNEIDLKAHIKHTPDKESRRIFKGYEMEVSIDVVLKHKNCDSYCDAQDR